MPDIKKVEHSFLENVRSFWTILCLESARCARTSLYLAISLVLCLWLGMVNSYADQTMILLDSEAEIVNAQGIILSDENYKLLVEPIIDEDDAETITGYIEGGSISFSGGTTVRLLAVTKYGDNIWYKVIAAYDDVEYEGYIDRKHLVISNEKVLELESRLFFDGKKYGAYLSDENMVSGEMAGRYNSDEESIEEGKIEDGKSRLSADVAAFPASYQPALMSLKAKHPNWVFVPQNTGLDFNTVINNEVIAPRSLVSASKSAAWGTDKYSTSWKIASRKAVEYCMDPRNYLSEQLIFAFEQLTYNSSYHSVGATQAILSDGFMSGMLPLSDMTYAQAFFRIGSSLGVSPYHLASRVTQEQGKKGTSPLITGTYPGFEGYYNYFNVSASGATNEAIYTSGLNYAKRKGWDSPYKALEGGAQVISANYILKGQDTLYLEKFDVDSSYSGMYTHQYMQNILAPRSESTIAYKGYNSANAVDNTFAFKIPVYNNMPANACPDPDQPAVSPSQNPTVTPSAGPNQNPTVTPSTPTVAPNFNEAEVKKFVTRLYKLVLEREPDATGLNDWVNRLKIRSTDGSSAAFGFFESEELKNRGVSDEMFVKLCYRTMLDREADESGLKDWTQKLKDGMSRIYVLSGFTNSYEYSKLCEGYGISAGVIQSLEPRDVNQGVTGFVSRCYGEVLGRGYDVQGLNGWTNLINNSPYQKFTAEQVASDGFFHSPEFLLKNTSDEEYIKILYKTFLGRDYDRAGFIDWLTQLKLKRKTRDEVMYGFSRSVEFSQIMESYGIR